MRVRHALTHLKEEVYRLTCGQSSRIVRDASASLDSAHGIT
jgi:hypothetical protein